MSQAKQSVSTKAIDRRTLRDRVGIFLVPIETKEELTQIREAERAGVQQIWTGDANNADTLTLFAIAAAQTEHIRLGTAIVSTYPRHPLVVARQALAIHDIAPGRLRLGLGSGGTLPIENWLGLSQTSPLPYLTEYLKLLRQTLWEGDANYEGNFFKTALPFSHVTQTPLLISALGPRAFRLAGEIADGALSWLCPPSYLLDQALPALRAGAQERQRPAPPLIAQMFVAFSKDETVALAAVRQRVERYARVSTYGRMFAHAGFAGVKDGNEVELNELARTLLIRGDEAEVSARIQELLASGLDELMLLPVTDEKDEWQRLLRLVGSL
ncbi:LLM class flavin-dependent oxidoreductase [Ktedonosporobacter rubrisoli]|uniref:LLM class flavin-dependent oxidoreductase n=1 Tax=Ktedonosporobacter rubrisoli TaxID=2509675 RepID=A0A4P6JMH2_KTERU|nr:LLM class flavin-dependent oxidoreductase [Ktedonosporobacter rubrisoli]QBD75886.1 LLM class flavin-dependent oxidoreductase [Ktedonosporobacter rubrisoli]